MIECFYKKLISLRLIKEDIETNSKEKTNAK
jgi:hypothetical protein